MSAIRPRKATSGVKQQVLSLMQRYISTKTFCCFLLLILPPFARDSSNNVSHACVFQRASVLLLFAFARGFSTLRLHTERVKRLFIRASNEIAPRRRSSFDAGVCVERSTPRLINVRPFLDHGSSYHCSCSLIILELQLQLLALRRRRFWVHATLWRRYELGEFHRLLQ